MKKKVPIKIIFFSLICMCLLTILDISINYFGMNDYYWVWKEYACAIRGINIKTAIQEHYYIEGVGYLEEYISTVPYGRILGNLVCPGFLDWNKAKIYGILLYCITLLGLIYAIWSHVSFSFVYGKKYIVFILLVIGLPLYWIDALGFMNMGWLICMLIIITVLITDKHEYFSGVLLAIVMLKPQIGLIFYVSFILKKKYKTIVTSIIILCTSWLMYIALVRENPITQILELFERTENKQPYFWYGIFDFLKIIGISSNISLLLSMIFGIVYTIVLSEMLLKSDWRDNKIVYYSIPVVASTLWCYKCIIDMIIVWYLSFLCFTFYDYIQSKYPPIYKIKNSMLVVIFLLLLNDKIGYTILRKILHYSTTMGMSIDAFIRLILCTAIILYLIKSPLNKQQPAL